MCTLSKLGLCLAICLAAAQILRPADAIKPSASATKSKSRASAKSLVAAKAAGTFEETVQPFIKENCQACHSTMLKTANLELESLNNAAEVPANREQWERVVKRITAGEMPPPRVRRPNAVAQAAAVNWLKAEFARADAQSGTNPNHIVARRLNRTEYNNTVRDLLGVDIDAASDFPQDDALYGFDNIGNALTVSPLLMGKYLAAAEKISRTAVFGPNLKAQTIRMFQPVPRRFEGANATKIQTPAYFSKDNYDVTGIQMPGAFHKIYKVLAEGDYNITLYTTGGWPQNSDPHFVDLYIDGAKVFTGEVPNIYTNAAERVPTPIHTRLHLAAGEHYLIAALPRVYEGLPANYKGPNPSKFVVPQRPQPPLPANATPEQIRAREAAAERQRNIVPNFDAVVMGEIDVEGPYNAASGPSLSSQVKVFTCKEKTAVCQRSILSNLAKRAFRRPVTDAEVNDIVKVATSATARGRSFEDALALAIEAILISPDFLFRIENQSARANHISDYELASRLSYFLWSTMPDDELMRAAAKNELRKPVVLEAQVRRMMKDSRSGALSSNFASQWLETRRLESVAPDRDRFPDFDEYLRFSMQRETELFFDNVMRQNRSILDFIDGKYTFLNERLAVHYGIKDVKGTEFRKVDLAGTNRGGILTQASVLTVSSYGNRTSPVLRGKWVLENLLNAPPPPPPPDVPKLDEAKVGSASSMRAQMEAHRANPACASCHSRMDPIGFALENYNAVGEWRDKDGEFAIDASGILTNGKSFSGASELKTILRSNPDQFAAALTEKLFVYALGRGVQTSDQPVIEAIVKQSAAQKYPFSSLILGIVNSAPFQMHGQAAVKVSAQTTKVAVK